MAPLFFLTNFLQKTPLLTAPFIIYIYIYYAFYLSIIIKAKAHNIMLMGSTEMENMRPETVTEEKQVEETEMVLEQNNSNSSNQNKKKKKKKGYYFLPRFGCLRSDGGVPTAEKPERDGGFSVEAGGLNGRDRLPTHLVVMVNGIIGRFFSETGSALSFSFEFQFFLILLSN